MICISIAQESRRLALVDMLNASRQADLLEVRLDRFGKAPEIAELLETKPLPVILTIRRRQDGGDFDGSEDERLALLRQCVINKPEYVEIELDVADQIRPFGPAKRVISYTNLRETPADIADIYAQAQTKKPDVIKLTTLARTPEEAWPLVQLLAKATVPTVVVGLGKPGVMLSVLGKKIGAPWAYAALERGMEAYPGQPTVHDLKTVYRYPEIEKTTRLIGVTGFSEREYATASVLNAALAYGELPARCLPMGVGSMRLFRKIMDAVKLAAVVVEEEHRGSMVEFATELDASAKEAGEADLLLLKGDRWVGSHTFGRATVGAVEAALRAKYPDAERPLQGRMVMVVGVNATARMLAPLLKARGAALIIASHEREEAKRLAASLETRFIQFEALYTTIHDVLVVCDNESAYRSRNGDVGVHPSYLKPGMTVVDLTSGTQLTPLLREAEMRGCTAITPWALLLDQLAVQARMLTGKEVPRAVLTGAMPEMPEAEEGDE